MKTAILKLSFIFSLIILLQSCGVKNEYTHVVIETEHGEMTAKLYNSTPQHRDNFIKLVREGFYDGLIFHRIIDGFMIQGGDPDSKNAAAGKRLGGGGPGYTIEAEIGSPHFKGTLAAARNNNPEKRSSGSQFYVVQGRPLSDGQLNNFESQKKISYTEEQRKRYKEFGGTPALDMDYTVFGEVTAGMDVIDKIAKVATDASDRPTEDVTMKIRELK